MSLSRLPLFGMVQGRSTLVGPPLDLPWSKSTGGPGEVQGRSRGGHGRPRGRGDPREIQGRSNGGPRAGGLFVRGCPSLKAVLQLNFLNSAPFDFNDGRRQPKRDCSRRRCEHERGCHPECPLLESSRYAQLALSLVLHSDAPGRRSQGSDGEHHRRAPRRNQLVCRDTATPSDRFEERCSRRKKVRSL
jgi:hypothetical protein